HRQGHPRLERSLMFTTVRDELRATLDEITEAGLHKPERVISTPQSAQVSVAGQEVLNFCANNYLGLADHPEVIEAAKQALDRWGFGMATARFICGTQDRKSTRLNSSHVKNTDAVFC